MMFTFIISHVGRLLPGPRPPRQINNIQKIAEREAMAGWKTTQGVVGRRLIYKWLKKLWFMVIKWDLMVINGDLW